MYGNLVGTDQYFRDSTVPALSDYGVGTAGVDGDDYDGVIYRWNNPQGLQSGSANGPWVADDASEHAIAFVAEFGVDAIHRDLVSIEISGFYDDAISATAVESVAQLCAYWAGVLGVRWDTYPQGPMGSLPFVYWHSDFGNASDCPGPVVRDLTPEIIARTREILMSHQQMQLE